MSALARFRSFSGPDRLLLLEALVHVATARAALLIFPFRWLVTWLGWKVDDSAVPTPAGHAPPQARRIASAVELVARRTPWESACLARATAAKLMLRKRGLASQLCLGTRIDSNGKLLAHAWLRCGDDVLVGAAEYRSFTFLSGFADRSP